MTSNLSKQRHLLTKVCIQQTPLFNNTLNVGKLERQVLQSFN